MEIWKLFVQSSAKGLNHYMTQHVTDIRRPDSNSTYNNYMPSLVATVQTVKEVDTCKDIASLETRWKCYSSWLYV